MSCEEREVRFVEDAWLNYFNRYLYDNEIISEKQYKQKKERFFALFCYISAMQR